jgi:hypothetical protein
MPVFAEAGRGVPVARTPLSKMTAQIAAIRVAETMHGKVTAIVAVLIVMGVVTAGMMREAVSEETVPEKAVKIVTEESASRARCHTTVHTAASAARAGFDLREGDA